MEGEALFRSNLPWLHLWFSLNKHIQNKKTTIKEKNRKYRPKTTRCLHPLTAGHCKPCRSTKKTTNISCWSSAFIHVVVFMSMALSPTGSVAAHCVCVCDMSKSHFHVLAPTYTEAKHRGLCMYCVIVSRGHSSSVQRSVLWGGKYAAMNYGCFSLAHQFPHDMPASRRPWQNHLRGNGLSWAMVNIVHHTG